MSKIYAGWWFYLNKNGEIRPTPVFYTPDDAVSIKSMETLKNVLNTKCEWLKDFELFHAWAISHYINTLRSMSDD